MTRLKRFSVATIILTAFIAMTAFMAMGIASEAQDVETASFSFTKVIDIDTDTPIADGTRDFRRNPKHLPVFPVPTLNNESVAFSSYGASDLQQGIYVKTGDSLNVIADRNTPIPNDTGNFYTLNEPTFNNDSVAFKGFGVTVSPEGGIIYTQEGIYTNLDGRLSSIADRNTPIPNGTGNFESFEGPVIDDESIAFLGSRGFQKIFQQGIYIKVGDSLNVIADYKTPIPGGTGYFTGFDAPALNNGSVVFKGFGHPEEGKRPQQEGIYTSLNGSLSVVADRNTPIPGGVGNFRSFGIGTPAIDKGNIAFIGYGDSQGIYTTLGGSLTKVIDNDDSLDGKTLSSSNFSSATLGLEGLRGNQIAFYAEFTDGSQDIYIATLNPTSTPESMTMLGVLSVGALSVGSALKQR